MKLLSVERFVTVFHRKNEELVTEIPIPDDVSTIKQIIKSRKDDDLFYLEYHLNHTKIVRLLKTFHIDLPVELKTYSYYLSCTGNYDWDKKQPTL